MKVEVLVSILVPVYNAEVFLRQCLDSLLSQTYKNIEIILVNDGSTDQSATICDSYAQKDPRVKVFHQPNAGVAKARITAFEHSSGEYVSFVDSDDYVDVTFVEQLLDKALTYSADIVSCGHYNVSSGIIKEHHYSMKGCYNRIAIRKALSTCLLYNRHTHSSGMTLYLCGKIFVRSFVGEALPIGSGLWFGEDQITFFYVLYRINILYVVNAPLYYYMQHENQATKRYDFSLWESQAECWRRYRQIDTDHLLGDQLDMRIWKTIYLNCKRRMKGTVNTAEQFGQEIEKAKKLDIIADFFRKPYLNDSLLENIKFWLLKYKFYGIYYKRVLKA